MNADKYLSEILDFYKYKLDHGLCTMEEINSVEKAIENNMEIYGSIEDLSKFYGVPEGNIRATISRKLIAKPKRKTMYPFHKFMKVVPEKWRIK